MKLKIQALFGYRLKQLLGATLLIIALLIDVAGVLMPQRVDAAPGDGHMLLFWPGGPAPSGWSCVSCISGDAFYQLFPRGNETYGATGGTTTHGHTTTNSISATPALAASITEPGITISDNSHAHSLSVTLGTASHIPAFRQLQIIRSNTAGEPTTIPSGAIALFDNVSLPANWVAYSAQNGWYARGEDTVGTTGGSNTHNHSIAITIGAATGTTHGIRNGSQVLSAAAAHTHTASGNSSTVNNEPPFVEVIFGQVSTDVAPPDNMLAMWDDDAPVNWTLQSGPSGVYHQRFLKGAATFGATGGSVSHAHVDTSIVTSGPSGIINSRSGSATASGSHTHTVTIANYSSESQIPPYRDVMIAKRVPQPTIEQSGYRFFANTDSTDVGLPLANLNSTASTPRQGKLFRLRLLLHIGDADLDAGNKTFKLQYAQRSGTCDLAFSGETFTDVSPSSGDIRYASNSTPNDGDTLTTNANDPTHAPHSIIGQTYEEANNFTNSTPIDVGEDGLWDFALQDVSAPVSTGYCFRVVFSDNNLLDTYSVVPEIITDDGNGHMLLLWDGPTIPTGWTCVSCLPADDFYQRFFRGSDSYGATGGAATHNHTFGSIIVSNTTGLGINNVAGSGVASATHTHSASLSVGSASNLPSYRQLRVIRASLSGVPTTIPAGAIAFFDAAVPAGWTRYAAQDNSFVRAADSVGATGGSNTHTNPITGNLSASSGQNGASTNGATTSSAVDAHTHTINGNSTSASTLPPYVEVILGKLNSDSPAPQNIITMWDNPEPVSWTDVSSASQPFHERFALPTTSFGATGGSATHSHTDSTVVSSAPTGTSIHRTGTTSADGTHTHNVTVQSISTESNLPPYIEVIFAKMGNLNTTPNAPTALDQQRTSDASQIAVGGYSNSGQVTFLANATDTDNPDSLQLCVEVQNVSTAFTNTATDCGSSVSYSGSAVSVEVTISGLSDAVNYHWQVQVKDSGGAVSSWVSFGANLETAADFIIDAADPTGTVYDGVTVSVDVDFNDGSLDELSSNWDISDAGSGLSGFEYAIGTTSGGTDIVSWTSHGLLSSVTANGLVLETSQVYYIAVRATDNANNQTVIVSDGQLVAPTLNFSTTNGISFDGLNPANSYTVTEQTNLTTSTNARNGYEIRAYASGILTSEASDTIPMYAAGSYATPSEWLSGNFGYGYTSNDPLVGGSNKFTPASCAGGGNGPCFAPFSLTAPGDVIADNTTTVSGSPIINETFTVTHRVSTDVSQNPGRYQTILIFNVTARY